MQYTEGSVFDGRYLLKKCMGRGSFGEVWLALDQNTEVEVAVKIYVAMDQRGLEEFKREFQVSFELNHTNLLRPNFLGVTPDDNCPYLVMTFCPNGSATKLSGIITEEQMWVFIHDVAAGLSFLHRQDPPIVHQDIKPDNILISKGGDYVITDFGISHKVRENMRKATAHLNSAGSVAYMGPEHFSKDYISMKASDIWSLGVTIYELAYGDLPFCGMGGGMLNNGADYPELGADRFSRELNITMQACLAKDTWDRPSADELEQYAAQKVKGENPPLPWKSPVQENSAEAQGESRPAVSETPSENASLNSSGDDMNDPDTGNAGKQSKTRIIIIAVIAAIIVIGSIVGIVIHNKNVAEQERIEAQAEQERIRVSTNESLINQINTALSYADDLVYKVETDAAGYRDVDDKVSALIKAVSFCREAFLAENKFEGEHGYPKYNHAEMIGNIRRILDANIAENRDVCVRFESSRTPEELEESETYQEAKAIIDAYNVVFEKIDQYNK